MVEGWFKPGCRYGDCSIVDSLVIMPFRNLCNNTEVSNSHALICGNNPVMHYTIIITDWLIMTMKLICHQNDHAN